MKLTHAIEEILKHHIYLSPGMRIVDLGCGDSPYELLFKEQGCEYIKCDLEGQVDIHIEPGKEINLPKRYANGVVSFQVLEHVWETDWYLNNCYRILKDNGWLLLSTHGNWLYHPHPHDYRRWTQEGLIKELEEHGFKVKVITPVVGPLALTTQFCLLGIYQVLKNIPVLGSLFLIPIASFMNLIMLFQDMITPHSFTEKNACVYVVLSCKPEPKS